MTLIMNQKMIFFFGAESPLSNWHPANFRVKGIEFLNNEQFMMYCKAKIFDDHETARKILYAKLPREHKELGRLVRGFDEIIWQSKRQHYVFIGCVAKFRQNPTLAEFLINTGTSELVEASPYDRIWGVGLSAKNPLIHDKKNWRGHNLLGQILMQVRDNLCKTLIVN